jgi:hypothetical protein
MAPRAVGRATACQDAVVESDRVRIKSAGETDATFRSRLELAWDVGFVADLILVDGSECSAVLIAMSATALILDRWDQHRRVPAGDPFTLELCTVAEVVVP